MVRKHQKIAHLSDEEIDIIIDMYYSGKMTVDEILKTYDIRVHKHSFLKVLPPIRLEEKCPICGEPYYLMRGPRKRENKNIPECLKCGHSKASNCYCPVCQAVYDRERVQAREEKRIKLLHENEEDFRALIVQYFSSSRFRPVEVSKMNFIDRVYLAAMLRYTTDESDRYNTKTLYSALCERNELFAVDQFMGEIVTYLTHRGLILLNEYSDIEAFVDVRPMQCVYFIDRVVFKLNVVDSENGELDFDKLMNPEMPSIDDEYELEQACELWKKVAIWDLVDYITEYMELLEVYYKPTMKLTRSLRKLLEDFSEAEVYWIIDAAGNLPRSFSWEWKIVHREKAMRYFFKSIKSIAKEVKDNGIGGFEKENSENVRTSHFNSFLYNDVFKVGRRAYYDNISVKNIKKYLN